MVTNASIKFIVNWRKKQVLFFRLKSFKNWNAEKSKTPAGEPSDSPRHIFLEAPNAQSAQHHWHLTFSQTKEWLQNLNLSMVKAYMMLDYKYKK